MSKGRILVDMDGVLSDFESELARRWRELWPDDPIEEHLERTDFEYDTVTGTIEDMNQKFNQIWDTAGFFEALPPIAGGREAIKSLLAADYDVRIVTSASAQLKAFSEKANWVHRYLDDDWVRRMVVTHDKYFIDGDVLIDDRVDVAKGQPTSWRQIIYDQPYNRHVDDRPRISWSDDDWLTTVEQTVAQLQANR